MLKFKIGDPVIWNGFSCEIINIKSNKKKQYVVAVISQVTTISMVLNESDITPA
jgi:hypothetical protein